MGRAWLQYFYWYGRDIAWLNIFLSLVCIIWSRSIGFCAGWFTPQINNNRGLSSTHTFPLRRLCSSGGDLFLVAPADSMWDMAQLQGFWGLLNKAVTQPPSRSPGMVSCPTATRLSKRGVTSNMDFSPDWEKLFVPLPVPQSPFFMLWCLQLYFKGFDPAILNQENQKEFC